MGVAPVGQLSSGKDIPVLANMLECTEVEQDACNPKSSPEATI